MPEVGVLAFQGGIEPHIEAFRRLGFPAREVRSLDDLSALTHLVIPGGESTTMRHLLDLFGLTSEIRRRSLAGSLALFGTCAGAILLGQDDGERPNRLGLLHATLRRNAYGRQVDSFRKRIALEGLDGETFDCVFIRAPRFSHVGAGLEVLGRDGDDPIAVREGRILATTFHPELSGDDRIHRYFLGC